MRMIRARSRRVAPLLSISVAAALHLSGQAQAPASKCVTLGAPKPAVLYTYRYADTSGGVEYTNQWKQFSATGSELVTTRMNGVSTYVSRHSVANDVFVLESHRGRGLARWLMEVILAHPELQGLRRWMLVTRDAHGLYERFGFGPPSNPGGIMVRARANPYGQRS